MADNEKKKMANRRQEVQKAELTETKREEFLEEVGGRTEGVAAEREKFTRGLYTGSPKMPYPNRKRE